MAQEAQIWPHLVIESHRRWQFHPVAVKWDDAQLIYHKDNLRILKQVDIASTHLFDTQISDVWLAIRCSRKRRAGRSKLHPKALHTDEHVDDVVDAQAFGVGAVKLFPTRHAEVTLDRVEAITDEKIGVVVLVLAIWKWGRLLGVLLVRILLAGLMFIYVGSERLFKFVREWIKVRPVFQKFDHRQLYTRESEEFFYTHTVLLLVLMSQIILWSTIFFV